MLRPYLYAKQLFRERSQDREHLAKDRIFFEGFLNLIAREKICYFLKNPLVSAEVKYHTIEKNLLAYDLIGQSQKKLLHRWLQKEYMESIAFVFEFWKVLVEDHLSEGEILIQARAPVSEKVLDAIRVVFQKAEPLRQFSFRFEKTSAIGITGSFRDSVLDMRTHTLLKKTILSLKKEGF